MSKLFLPFSFFKVSGHSMEPSFHSGDLILVNHLVYKWRQPKKGEVILFKRDNQFILKKVVEKEVGQVLVEGENKLDSREFGWVKKEEIVGKVLRVF